MTALVSIVSDNTICVSSIKWEPAPIRKDCHPLEARCWMRRLGFSFISTPRIEKHQTPQQIYQNSFKLLHIRVLPCPDYMGCEPTLMKGYRSAKICILMDASCGLVLLHIFSVCKNLHTSYFLTRDVSIEKPTYCIISVV